MRTPVGLALLWLVGCTGGAEAPPPDSGSPSADEPVVHPDDASPSSDGGGNSLIQVNAGEAVPIQLSFTTVGPLHQGFFGRESSVRSLGKALGVCTDHTVEVQVVWSQKDLEGRIVGQIPHGTSVCAPRPSGGGFDLTPMVPATKGLAAYRDSVAGMSDFRIANFVVAADLRGRSAFCRLRAAGQHPPDGTRFHPCVEINGARVCAEGDRDKGVQNLRFSDPADARKFAACL